jgi:hypothetical protein
MSNDSIVSLKDNVFEALRPGTVCIKATSVLQQMEDSCQVQVMKWGVNPYAFPDEMVFFAKFYIEGKEVTPNTCNVAAFVDGECRGVGEYKEYQGNYFYMFRVYGSTESYSGKREVVRFRVYRSDNLLCGYFPNQYVFDGDTYGSISSPLLFTYTNGK